MIRNRAVQMVCASGALALASAFLIRRKPQTLAKQVVLITGGSRGLGLAMAREFGARGCRLAICARDGDELERATQMLQSESCEVFAVPCDVTDRDAIAEAISTVKSHYGQIDILVNNAGEITVSPLENLEISDFERAMNVMFWGPLHTTIEVLPHMRQRGRGHIVNITSIGGKVSVPHLLSYSCAKAAGIALSDGLRPELRRFGVDVTTVIPGLMRTGSHVNARFKGNQEAEAAWFGSAASMPLLALDAEHAARTVVDAVSDRKSQLVLGTPAKLLVTAQALAPELTAEALSLSNALLPGGSLDRSVRTGLEMRLKGALYEWLTTLGRRAGQRLNQQQA